MSDAHMRAFGDSITIYGEGNKVNFFSASEKVLKVIIRYCAQNRSDQRLKSKVFMNDLMKRYEEYKGTGAAIGVQGLINFFQANGIALDQKKCENSFTTTSKTFLLTSTATVGDVTRKLKLVARVVGNNEELYYFNNL